MNVIEREMQELKEIIENGRINLLPAERVAENILAAGYRQTFNEKRFENNMRAVLEIEKKQAVKEFAEKLKNKLFDFFQENEDLDGKISTGILYIDIIGVEAKDGAIILLGLIDELLKDYKE